MMFVPIYRQPIFQEAFREYVNLKLVYMIKDIQKRANYWVVTFVFGCSLSSPTLTCYIEDRHFHLLPFGGSRD